MRQNAFITYLNINNEFYELLLSFSFFPTIWIENKKRAFSSFFDLIKFEPNRTEPMLNFFIIIILLLDSLIQKWMVKCSQQHFRRLYYEQIDFVSISLHLN